MELQLSLLFFVEAVGTIAFASSGAMVAIKKQLDLLGVIVLGVTTAVGGGMLRDIIIGNVPPNLFKDPVYVLLAFITVMILFVIVRCNQKILASRSIEMYEKVMNIFDAVGLGAFTVVGIDTAVLAGYGRYHFLIIFLGVITGVGGGVLRDIMAGNMPYVFVKHIYACASLAGALLCTLLWKGSAAWAMSLGAGLVILIRCLSAHFRWSLPKAHPKE